MLGQDSIAIQITGDDPATNNEEVLDGPIAIEATEEGHDGEKLVKTVRFSTCQMAVFLFSDAMI